MSKFYITTPIYYANDRPHIGHAYNIIAADVVARYHRMHGDETFFLTGTDEHGAKIQEVADKAKKSPKDFVDEISASFALAWDSLNISNDYFIRTTDKNHKSAVQEVLLELFNKKYIYKGEYQALYCVGCEQYKTRAELQDGECPDHKRKPEIYSEEAYLFRLSDFGEKILACLQSNKLKILPETRKNEIISFLRKEKLHDVAISRQKGKVSWGIELPFDKNHTTYVWVDAFLNYLTGLGWPKSRDLYEKFWPADLQLMSKDIMRVHATLWPGLLLALGEKLPKRLFIHGYLTVNGEKMGKSLGNAVDPVTIASKYTLDGLRYFLLREIPFGEDGDFSEERLRQRYNSDLAHGLGNLCSRILTMAEKYFKGLVPPKVKAHVHFWPEWEKSMEALAFHHALDTVWGFTRYLDRKINEEEPWVLVKTDERRLRNVLYVLLESLRQIAWMILPFMPETSDRIFEQLGIEKTEKKKKFSEARQWGELEPGTKVKLEKPLFPRM